MAGRRVTAWICLVGADAGALRAAAPDWHRLRTGLAAPTEWVSAAGASAAAAELARAVLWSAAVWLAVALGAAALPLLPGLPGRIGGRLAGALVPAVLRRVLAGTAGLGVALSPAAALASAPAPAPAPPAVSACTELPTPGWPLLPTPRASTPPPERPSAPPAAAGPDRHLVAPGDSLWRIAAAELGRDATAQQVAASWPRWYAVNRATIGADPNLLRPGQLLRDPAAGRR